jgi:hypothetical protein
MGRFLKWTGHQPAIAVVFGLSLLGFAMTLAVDLEWIDTFHPLGPWVSLTGLALTLGGFFGFCAFVRCPRCQTRVFWNAVSKQSHPNGIHGLLRATECTICREDRHQGRCDRQREQH